MIVYLARDIPAFVMYCVNGESGSSLLNESTDSMIYLYLFLYMNYFIGLFFSREFNNYVGNCIFLI